MNHLELGTLESKASQPSKFELFADKCEQLCKTFIGTDHKGNPSFDGDQEKDGYSLDWLKTVFDRGFTPIDVYRYMKKKTCSNQ